MFNTQFQRPATVLLSAMWSLATVLAIAAFAVSASASPSAPVLHAATPKQSQSVESVTSSSMLREPRLAISKDKLD